MEDTTIKSLKFFQKNNPEPINEIINTNKNQNKPKTNPEQTEEKTIGASTIVFLDKDLQTPSPENLNINQPFPQDTISTSTGAESNNSKQDENSTNSKKKSFAGKTKEWAGNMWNSIKSFNFKNIFPKQEFKEFRNANGDMVRIPVKKIPLKKKTELNENVKNRISEEQNKIISNYHGAATGMYLIG